MLGLALTKYSGKFGVLNYAVEGMMSSLVLYHPFCRYAAGPPVSTRKLRHGRQCGVTTRRYGESEIHHYSRQPGSRRAQCTHEVYIYQAQREGEGRRYRTLAAVADRRQSRSLPARAAAQTARWRWEWRVIWWIAPGGSEFCQQRCSRPSEFSFHLRNNVTVEWAAEICGPSADVGSASWRKSLRRRLPATV